MPERRWRMGAAAYGWPVDITDDDALRELLDLTSLFTGSLGKNRVMG